MVLHGSVAMPADLTALTLDAALQLDRLARHKAANLETIDAFVKQLGSPSEVGGHAGLFCLHENPVNVDILNSALFRSEGPTIANVADLEVRLNNLIDRINDVVAGKLQDAQVLTALKRFCLSLHATLLEELTPRVDRDEWMTIQ